MRASVDPDLCTGCGLCVDACPKVFELGEDGLAAPIADPVPPGEEDTCQQAADECPVEAILIEP